MQFAALFTVAAFYAHYVPFSFTQVAVQVTQTLSGANLHHAGHRHRATYRAILTLFAVFSAGFAGDQISHLRPVERQRSPDKRRFIAADGREIRGKQCAGHIFQLLSRCLLQILNHCQRRAAHFRFQLSNQRHQQLLPVLITRQNVNIQRGLALCAGFFNARGQIHLQRMVVQHHFLGVGDKRSKAQVITQRIMFCQLAQTLGAAVV